MVAEDGCSKQYVLHKRITVIPVQMTTRLRWPMLSPPKQIRIQSLLYKTTTCLMQPATTFFVSQTKKTCLKQPL